MYKQKRIEAADILFTITVLTSMVALVFAVVADLCI